MCSVELTEREKQIKKLYWEEGKTHDQIKAITGLAKSSVKAYIYSIKRKFVKAKEQEAMELKAESKAKRDATSVFKDTKAGSLYAGIPHELLTNVRTLQDLKNALDSIKDVPESLEERVEEFKLVYCAACTVKHMCKECPNKLLWEKYLY